MRWFLRSKIHKAIVTESNLNYIDSIAIDKKLLEKVGFLAGEKVLVVSNTSGARLETYAILEKRGSGIICINGAASRLIKKGEEITIMGFELSNKSIEAKNIIVDKNNKISELRSTKNLSF